jgi:hypothetical protein
MWVHCGHGDGGGFARDRSGSLLYPLGMLIGVVGVRRWAIAAGAVLIVGSATVGVVQWSGRGDHSRVTTPQSLAAAAMRHVPAGLRLVKVQRSPADHPAKHLLVRLAYDTGGKEVAVVVEVFPKDEAMPYLFDDCRPTQPDSSISCQYRTLADGMKSAVIRMDDLLGVSVKQGNGDVVLASLMPADADDEPIGVDILSAIAADPLVGLTTSQKMIDAGKDITVTEIS